MKSNRRNSLLFYLFLIPHILLITMSASAEDDINISSDYLEYYSESNTYVAKGSVILTYGDASLTADEMRIDSNTYDAVAEGNVIYKDPDATITGKRLELNLKTKLGAVYESYIFYQRNNFHLRSPEVRKTGDKTFYMDEATITTCDAVPPEWHISAREITAEQHKDLEGWHGTFNIRNIPVLYTPYFWAPLIRERQTGFLFPSFGYSNRRGYYYKQGFFWAMRDNYDATLYADYYSELGLGEGLDYRYILSPESDGELWIYHVRDGQSDRSLAEFKAYHNQRFSNNISGYLKLQAVSEPDYYETMDSTSRDRFGLSSWESTRFGISSEERYQKYLESDMHISKQYSGGRIYLLNQGRQSLEGSSSEIPQSLPEIGFILNTKSIKFLSYNVSLKGANFWREKGQEGTRFDIYPNLYLSYGRLFNITQKVGLRETAYFLNEPGEYEDRFLYDLDTTLTTKLFKRYPSFIHIIEPSLEYTYIPSADQENIPFFDSTDFIPETNRITYALTNRISGLSGHNLETRFRLSQSYSLLDMSEPFSPLLAEATIKSARLDLSINASYDVDDNILTELIGSTRLKGEKGYVGIGKNLRRSTDLDQYTFEIGIYSPIKIIRRSLPIDLRGKLWYDTENGRIQELNVASAYKKQCWGFSVAYNRRPDEYQIIFAVEFTGLGTFSLGSI